MKLPVDYTKLGWKQRKEVREKYCELQNNNCYYCGKDLNVRPKQTKSIKWSRFPKNFLNYPVHLHHCHKTGMTIGAVHSYCNAILWQYHNE